MPGSNLRGAVKTQMLGSGREGRRRALFRRGGRSSARLTMGVPIRQEVSMPPYRASLGAALLAGTLAAAPAAADEKDQAHHHPRPEKLGTVSFPTSCAPAVQARFVRAVALLHSFWYDEAEKAFNEVAAADPSCAMAQWGVAMSLYHPIWAAPTPAEVKRGQEAVAKARAAGAPTERERDYVAAIEAFFRDPDTVDHRSRAQAYEKAMERVHERYPDDREAAIFYSLALLGTAPPSDKTYTNQKKAGEAPSPAARGNKRWPPRGRDRKSTRLNSSH